MRPRPKIPTYDALWAAIAAAPSSADLAPLLLTARTYFTGTQREELEAAASARERELPDGGSPGL
jgi:hypothetical protein